MKLRFSPWSLAGLNLALVAVLLLGGAAFAQESQKPGPFAALAGGMFLMFFLGFILAAYVYMSLALQTIADKTGTANSWLAWIPIANAFLMLSVAKKPMWWFILFLIPLVNIVIAIMVWMAVAEARGKPNWWGVLMIVPIANLVVPGYLAWAD
jgi:succinate dehydrogenase hydrophobic anchor subunit